MQSVKSVFAICLLAASSFSVAHAAQDDSVISTGQNGPELTLAITGSAQGRPDRAIVSSGVIANAPTASEAIAQNARKMATLFSALDKMGVDRRFVQTSRINLTQQFRSNPERGRPRIPTGYEARNDISIRLVDVQDTGGVIDALVVAGADRITGPQFTLNDDSKLVQEARENAMDKASALSRFYASSTGYRRADIISITENVGYGGRVQLSNAIVAGGRPTSDSATPVEAGEVQRTVSVTVKYRLVR